MNSSNTRRKLLQTLTIGVLALLAHGPSTAAYAATDRLASPADRCSALSGAKIGAKAFALPTKEANIAEATLVTAKGENGVAYCQVRGAIAPVGKNELPIQFQLNLPVNWNGKAAQFGGGGSNGVVIDGLGAGPHAPKSVPTPLNQGYATFGGDSGHKREDVDWVNNAQAFANFAGESVKRTRDAAIAIIAMHYGKSPKRTYFVGGSKGGQEGLVAAQRYGRDYDGVVAYYPAARAFAMQMSWGAMGYAVRKPGARLTPGQQVMVKQKVLAACDGLDGARDGLVSNIKACRSAFALETLKCPDGAGATDACLTDAQLQGLRVAATPMTFDFPLANGTRSIGPYPVLEGADFGWLLYPDPAAPWGAIFAGAGDDIAKQISGDQTINYEAFDYRKYRDAVLRHSNLYDATSTNLEAFRSHGGKLLMFQGTVDLLVPHDMTSEYFQSLRNRYGSRLDRFARYYVQPGFGHGGGDFDMTLDSLALLDRWVERGRAPGQLIATDAAKPTAGRTRPLCEYPRWPRYLGSGDMADAASFSCVAD